MVDYVEIDDKQYSATNHLLIFDESYIDEEIGKAQFTLDGTVFSPSYELKNGNTAYLEKGTRFI